MKIGLLKKAALLATLLAVIALSACEINTKVKIAKEAPPKFSFSGNGSLAQLYVTGPMTLDELRLTAGKNVVTDEELQKIKQVTGSDRILWQIDPAEVRKIISDLPPITYGIVPSGFKQIRPKDEPAPPLLDGKYYCVSAPTNNAGSSETYFMIQDGKAIEVSLDQILKSSQSIK